MAEEPLPKKPSAGTKGLPICYSDVLLVPTSRSQGHKLPLSPAAECPKGLQEAPLLAILDTLVRWV